MQKLIFALAGAALLSVSNAALAAGAADCQTIMVKWSAPSFAANGHFTLNVPEKTINAPWSDHRTAIIRGKLRELNIDGNQIYFETRELHEVTITIDEDCNVIALSGEGNHPDQGPYQIVMGKE